VTAPIRAQSFVAFCETTLALSLTAPWRVLLKVTIDGVHPRDLEGEEREIAAALFGPKVEEIDPRLRRILVWRLGRSSGKSTIAAALCIYLAWTSDVSRAGPGQIPTAFVVAPEKPLARIGLGIARELVRASALERYVCADKADSGEGFQLRRLDGRLVAIRVVAASKRGQALRGVDVIVLVLDESEFFETSGDASGEGYSINDRDQISAVMPRLIGHVVCVSTPWPSENATAEYFDRNFGRPVDAVAALGPSDMMRPSEQLRLDIARELLRDEEDARREFYCEPGIRGGARMFDVPSILAAVVEGRPMVIRAPAGAFVGAGADLAFERDASAIAIVSNSGGWYDLCEYEEVRPNRGSPLVPGTVIRGTFAPIMGRHGVQAVMADAHYRQSAREHLSACRLDFLDAPTGQQGKYDTYMFTRDLLRSGRLRIPSSPKVIAQLKAVIKTAQPGGGIKITSPRRTGSGHGDIASALVLAAWSCSRRAANTTDGHFYDYPRARGGAAYGGISGPSGGRDGGAFGGL